MKLGKVFVLGLFGLLTVYARVAGAQSAPSVNGITVEGFCNELQGKFKENLQGKCQANLTACEQNINDPFENNKLENGCTSRDLVECPPDSPSGLDCFEVTVDPVCVEKSLAQAMKQIAERIVFECGGDRGDNTPELPTKPGEPQDPKDPAQPEIPVEQPEQPAAPAAPTEPFQVEDNGQGQAALAGLTLSGGGCSLNLGATGTGGMLTGLGILLPLLGLRRKK